MSIAPMLLAALVATAPTAPDPFAYETVTVAPNIYAFVENRLNPIVSSTIVAVVGDSAVLVFDTGYHPSITRRIAGDIARLTDRPVRWVVNSHWHDDHFAGNPQMLERWPGAQIVAHEFTARLMDARKDGFRGEQCRKAIDPDAERLRAQLASGKRADGTPIPEQSRRRVTDFLEAIDAHLAECDRMTYRGVDRTFTDSLRIDLGGRTVTLAFLGRGNTAGDVTALIPDAHTILVGDLLVYPFPFATQSYITEWAAVLRRIERMDVAHIVPGHGMPMTDKRYLRDVAEVLESISAQARAAWHDGMTADELRAQIDLTPFADRFSNGDPFIRANFDAMMKGSAIDRMWQELSGKWKPEGV